MEFTHRRTVKIVAALLLLAALSQPLYTALYLGAPEVNRAFIWRFEALIFVLLTAFAGAALAGSKRYSLGFAAIAFSAVLNVVQVGVGLTQFGPARAVAKLGTEVSGFAASTFAYSFYGYNAAKILLALAAIVFGMAVVKAGSKALNNPLNKFLNKFLGSLSVLVGIVAFFANSAVMMFGTNGLVPSPLAGGSGVAATLLLAICLLSLKSED